MGYSNVAGDLNVYSITSTQDLIVRGDATHYGNLLSYGASSFANLTAANLTVTGNFTVSSTNTSFSNALSIVNQGTSTALYVNQNEFPNMTYNVAEFWDHTQLAMVIDGYGNVAIHTAVSLNYALTVVDGASIDTLTLGTPLAISSGGTGAATAPQNTVFAGTATGGTNPPLFRSLVNADLPASVVVSNVTANGAALSSLNASNIAFGTIPNSQLPTSPVFTTLNVLSISNLNSLNVTTTSNTTQLAVPGSLTANATNTTFFFDTFSIPFIAAATINVGTINAWQISNLNTLSAVNFVGSGNTLSNLNASNLAFGVVAAAQLATAQTNVTSLGTLTGLNASGNVTAPFFIGGGNTLSNLNASNLAFGVVAAAQLATAQTNVTSLGTLTGLNASGNVTAPFFIGGGNTLSNLNASNLAFGAVGAAQVQSAQTNVTSLGTLTGLNASGNVTAPFFIGGGNTLSNLNASNLAFGVVAATQLATAQTNITSVGTLTGLNASGNVTAPFFIGGGNTVSNLNASNLAFGVVAAAQLATAQTNITSVGTLTGLNASGNVTAPFFIGGGNTVSNLNASNLAFGTVANGLLPASISVTNIYSANSVTTTNLVTAGFTSNASNTIFNYSTLTVPFITCTTLNVSTTSNLGVVSASNVTANGAGISSMNASNLTFGVVAAAQLATAQTNVTSLGTLTGLNASGNVTAPFFIGGGNTISNLNASNLAFGTVANGLLPAIISVSNVTANGAGLSSLNASNITFGTLANSQLPAVISVSNVTANGAGLSSLNASNITFGTLANSQLPSVISVSNVTANGAGLSSLNASNITFGTLANSQLPAIISVSNVTANGAGLSSLNASNITFGTHPINTGGTNQTAYGTTNGVLYYDGTRFQAASGITASTATTLNVNTLNVSTFQTTTLIPASSGLFMNLTGTYTLSGNWTGNIAGTITSNLYNLFGATGGSGWAAIGSNPFIIGPSANGSFRFTQAGPYMITAVITADNDIKTIAISSNTSDVHSNLANPGVWLYAFRFGVGTTQSFPVTLPINVTNTSTYYFIDIETAVQNDNIHQTAYTNVATNSYTGSYVLVRPI